MAVDFRQPARERCGTWLFVFSSLPTRQNIRIWMASVLIRIEPTPAPNGGDVRAFAFLG